MPAEKSAETRKVLESIKFLSYFGDYKSSSLLLLTQCPIPQNLIKRNNIKPK